MIFQAVNKNRGTMIGATSHRVADDVTFHKIAPDGEYLHSPYASHRMVKMKPVVISDKGDGKMTMSMGVLCLTPPVEVATDAAGEHMLHSRLMSLEMVASCSVGFMLFQRHGDKLGRILTVPQKHYGHLSVLVDNKHYLETGSLLLPNKTPVMVDVHNSFDWIPGGLKMNKKRVEHHKVKAKGSSHRKTKASRPTRVLGEKVEKITKEESDGETVTVTIHEEPCHTTLSYVDTPEECARLIELSEGLEHKYYMVFIGTHACQDDLGLSLHTTYHTGSMPPSTLNHQTAVTVSADMTVEVVDVPILHKGMRSDGLHVNEVTRESFCVGDINDVLHAVRATFSHRLTLLPRNTEVEDEGETTSDPQSDGETGADQSDEDADAYSSSDQEA